jgi:hypothetical protein
LPTQWRRLGIDSPESLQEFLLLRFPDVDASRIQVFLFRPDSYVLDAAGWRAFRLTTPSDLSSAAERVESADAEIDWQRIKQLAAAQLPNGRLASRGVADGSELEPEGRVGNPVDGLSGHCQELMTLLRYCGEASDLSIMPQITAAVGYLVACMEPGRSDEPPQSVATAKWDEKTCRAVATVLRGYEGF